MGWTIQQVLRNSANATGESNETFDTSNQLLVKATLSRICSHLDRTANLCFPRFCPIYDACKRRHRFRRNVTPLAKPMLFRKVQPICARSYLFLVGDSLFWGVQCVVQKRKRKKKEKKKVLSLIPLL